MHLDGVTFINDVDHLSRIRLPKSERSGIPKIPQPTQYASCSLLALLDLHVLPDAQFALPPLCTAPLATPAKPTTLSTLRKSGGRSCAPAEVLAVRDFRTGEQGHLVSASGIFRCLRCSTAAELRFAAFPRNLQERRLSGERHRPSTQHFRPSLDARRTRVAVRRSLRGKIRWQTAFPALLAI
eukprot:scaffold550_cov238-Pinguiococcus_pyrenoidosus.AAC.7